MNVRDWIEDVEVAPIFAKSMHVAYTNIKGYSANMYLLGTLLEHAEDANPSVLHEVGNIPRDFRSTFNCGTRDLHDEYWRLFRRSFPV